MITSSEAPITHLVFEGGGVLGAAYAGAMQALDEQQVLAGIEGVCGTSIGSVMALMVALRLPVPTIRKLALDTNYHSLQDGGWLGPLRLLTRFGWYSGKAARKNVEDIITGSGLGLKADATFADLRAAGCRHLKVVATNASRRFPTFFSVTSHPDMCVADAVRMSMSLPFFLASVTWQGERYIDGGVMLNYPIDAFHEEGVPDAQTLGFAFCNMSEMHPEPEPIGGLIRFVKVFLECNRAQQDILLLTDADVRSRTVLITRDPFYSTDLGITKEQLEELMRRGYEATLSYFGPAGKPAA